MFLYLSFTYMLRRFLGRKQVIGGFPVFNYYVSIGRSWVSKKSDFFITLS